MAKRKWTSRAATKIIKTGYGYTGFARTHKTCKVCGKKFPVYDIRYAYKKQTAGGFRWYCSWHCLRENEKAKEKKDIANLT